MQQLRGALLATCSDQICQQLDISTDCRRQLQSSTLTPISFLLQEAFIVPNQGVTHSSGMTAMPGMVPVPSAEYLYQLPPGSPVYLRSPTAFTATHSWNNARRAPSRLSGMQGKQLLHLFSLKARLPRLALEFPGLA